MTPSPAKPLVSFVVVTWNRREALASCLRSLRLQARPDCETVIVDNGSTDGTAELVAASFPDMKLIRSPEDLGVASGRNLGIGAAAGDYLILIDDDACFEGSDVVEQTLTRFEREPHLAAIAFTIRDAANGEVSRKSIPFCDKRVVPGDVPCSYFCGAGFALRRSALPLPEPFWPPLFYGAEELDTSFRLLDRGKQILFTDAVTVIHREWIEDRPSGQWVYYHARNRCWVAARNLPLSRALSTTVAWWLFTGWVAIRGGHKARWLHAIADAWRGLPAALSTRRSLKRSTLARVGRLSGRTWY